MAPPPVENALGAPAHPEVLVARNKARFTLNKRILIVRLIRALRTSTFCTDTAERWPEGELQGRECDVCSLPSSLLWKTTDTMAPSAEVLSLYRSILGAARRFPSIKRHKIVEEIRIGFREHRDASGEELQAKLSVAIKGLSQLEQYSFSKKATSWSVNLEQNPMPQSAAREEKARQEKEAAS